MMKSFNYRALALALIASAALSACDNGPSPSNPPPPPTDEKCSPASDSCPKPD